MSLQATVILYNVQGLFYKLVIYIALPCGKKDKSAKIKCLNLSKLHEFQKIKYNGSNQKMATVL